MKHTRARTRTNTSITFQKNKHEVYKQVFFYYRDLCMYNFKHTTHKLPSVMDQYPVQRDNTSSNISVKLQHNHCVTHINIDNAYQILIIAFYKMYTQCWVKCKHNSDNDTICSALVKQHTLKRRLNVEVHIILLLNSRINAFMQQTFS